MRVRIWVKVRPCLARVQRLLAGFRAADSEDTVRDFAGLGYDLREVAVCAHGTESGRGLGEAVCATAAVGWEHISGARS